MNEPEPMIAQLSAKIDEILVGIKWASALFLVLFSIPNICVAQTIGRYGQIFQDALPGQPLPLLTVVVLSHRTFLQLLTLVWPVLGVLNIVYGKRARNWAIGSAIILLLIGLQIGLTQSALLSPMMGLITGMPDTSAK